MDHLTDLSIEKGRKEVEHSLERSLKSDAKDPHALFSGRVKDIVLPIPNKTNCIVAERDRPWEPDASTDCLDAIDR